MASNGINMPLFPKLPVLGLAILCRETRKTSRNAALPLDVRAHILPFPCPLFA